MSELHDALDENDIDQAKELLEDDDSLALEIDEQGRTPMHVAAMACDDPEMFQLLIDANADVDALTETGQTPLHFAAAFHNMDAAGALIEAGATVAAEDEDGNTPLHSAVARDETAEDAPAEYELIIDLLLDNGADIDHLNASDSTPLHLAAAAGALAAVDALVDRGADPSAQDADGRTPRERAQEAAEKGDISRERVSLNQRLDKIIQLLEAAEEE